ncbi:hypothetical protein AVEN_65636-1 [Araneus ventricosus]|uniref:Uncharacterized protein n=1 Tax=Araneus ventricosus TaxID=182803 RepID=A0A4Y2J2G7_ARAVE|nr:hypothetical protein AVEN_65636-1 [Araneus ventricosus]
MEVTGAPNGHLPVTLESGSWTFHQWVNICIQRCHRQHQFSLGLTFSTYYFKCALVHHGCHIILPVDADSARGSCVPTTISADQSDVTIVLRSSHPVHAITPVHVSCASLLPCGILCRVL